MSELKPCPFCGEPEFDAVGLRMHLNNGHCEPFCGPDSRLSFSPSWIPVSERLPECSKKKDSLGVEVQIYPVRKDGATAFYGRRVTNEPAFYKHGAVLDYVTHWTPLKPLPAAPAGREGE